MSTQDYIKEFESYLSNIDKDKRNELIKEIESYINESDVNYSSLVERFGTPDELAQSYLEDIPTKEKKGKSFFIKTKRAVKTISIFVFVVVSIIAFVFYTYSKDAFDYSKYNATTIDKQIDVSWSELEDVNQIKVEQAQVVFYWSDNNKLQYSCEGNSIYREENIFFIKQSRCYVKVPKQQIDIKSFQAQIVLVEPNSNVNVNTEQTTLRIAQKNSIYKYNFNAKQSDIQDLDSKENGILINGKLFQSDVSSYKY